ncbi:MAG: hypothetical protein JXR76_27935 [Deltaproteobacteria bacterium]|nr:hypothetical protein [Deltaproteobacteria bacterium]
MKSKMIKWSLLGVLVLLATGCGGNEGYKKLVAGTMPEMGTWDGVYFSEAYGRMELSDNGNGTIIGLYEGERFHGKIEGVPEGDLMNFQWTQWNEDLNGKSRQTKGHGYFRYTVKEEGTAEKSRLTHYIEGEWGYLDANSGNAWSCVKFPQNTKKILTMDGKTAEENAAAADPFAGGGGGAPASDSGDAAPESGGSSMDSTGGGGLSDDVNDLF